MTDILLWIDYLSRAVSLALGGGVLVAFFFKEKIKQVLSRSLLKDIERIKHEHSINLAATVSAHQRELEAYKVSLIAEAERVKAQQEIRKTLALKIGERRYVAIAELLDSLVGADVLVATHVSRDYAEFGPLSSPTFAQEVSEITQRIKRLSLASQVARPYLTPEQKATELKARTHLINLAAARRSENADRIDQDSDQVKGLFDAFFDAERMLIELVRSMEQLS